MPSKPYTNVNVKGMEVGDDRVDLSLSAFLLCVMLSVQEKVLQMCTSKDDTSVTKDVWNFCEVTNALPTSKTGGFDFARRTGDFKDLDFTDSPALRLVTDVQKGDRSHSSTVTGKASMLGSRTNACRSEHWESLQISQLMQDGLLRTARAPDPKYLHGIMGGCNVKPLFGLDCNTFLYLKAYRGGGYDRVYGSAVQEIKKTLQSMERGVFSCPILCSRLRDRQEYLHGTYGSQIFIPTRQMLKAFDKAGPGPPLYEANSGQNQFSSLENRLLATKTLLGRRGAEVEIAKTRRLFDQLLGIQDFKGLRDREKLVRFQARQEFGGALQGNTAFKRLLDRNARGSEAKQLLAAGFLMVDNAVTEFRLSDAVWLGRGGKSEIFTIDDITFNEDMFLRKEVSLEESMKISGIPLKVLYNNKASLTLPTVSRVGLWQINETMRDWAENIGTNLRDLWVENDRKPLRDHIVLGVYNKNREWVNDDSTLISVCCRASEAANESSFVGLISDDHRLGNQMSKTANVQVIRLSAKEFVKHRAGTDFLDSSFQMSIGEFAQMVDLPPNEQRRMLAVYTDTGSLASACARVHTEAEGASVFKYTRTPLDTGTNGAGTRWSKYTLEKMYRKNTLQSVRHYPITKDSGRKLRGRSTWTERRSGNEARSSSEPSAIKHYGAGSARTR